MLTTPVQTTLSPLDLARAGRFVGRRAGLRADARRLGIARS